MGIMICDIHDRVGFVEVCSHIAKQIDHRAIPVGRRFTILGNIFICNECFDSLGFDRCISLADLTVDELIDVVDGRWEIFEEAYDGIEGRRSYCLKCLSELEQSHSP